MSVLLLQTKKITRIILEDAVLENEFEACVVGTGYDAGVTDIEGAL